MTPLIFYKISSYLSGMFVKAETVAWVFTHLGWVQLHGTDLETRTCLELWNTLETFAIDKA